VERMSRHVQREAKELSFVGDEWSDAASLTEVGKGLERAERLGPMEIMGYAVNHGDIKHDIEIYCRLI